MFVELLAEGSSHTVPAELVHLDAWISDRELPFTTAIDPAGVGMRIVEQLSPRENAFLVELSTMKVLFRTTSPSALYQKLDAL
ncbi:MAG: hypothetical protein U0263_01650 [Polyangiaceae bacterium]